MRCGTSTNAAETSSRPHALYSSVVVASLRRMPEQCYRLLCSQGKLRVCRSKCVQGSANAAGSAPNSEPIPHSLIIGSVPGYGQRTRGRGKPYNHHWYTSRRIFARVLPSDSSHPFPNASPPYPATSSMSSTRCSASSARTYSASIVGSSSPSTIRATAMTSASNPSATCSTTSVSHVCPPFHGHHSQLCRHPSSSASRITSASSPSRRISSSASDRCSRGPSRCVYALIRTPPSVGSAALSPGNYPVQMVAASQPVPA